MVWWIVGDDVEDRMKDKNACLQGLLLFLERGES